MEKSNNNKMEAKLLKIASQFDLAGAIAEIKPLGEGFINDTFIVKTEGDAPNYILQRKNHIIFPDVPGMMENIKAGMDANEAVKKATGTYGRFADAAKYIDPRHE